MLIPAEAIQSRRKSPLTDSGSSSPILENYRYKEYGVPTINGGDTANPGTPWGNSFLWHGRYYDFEVTGLQSGVALYGEGTHSYDPECGASASRLEGSGGARATVTPSPTQTVGHDAAMGCGPTGPSIRTACELPVQDYSTKGRARGKGRSEGLIVVCLYPAPRWYQFRRFDSGGDDPPGLCGFGAGCGWSLSESDGALSRKYRKTGKHIDPLTGRRSTWWEDQHFEHQLGVCEAPQMSGELGGCGRDSMGLGGAHLIRADVAPGGG